VKAIILAAGRGSRLGNLTEALPKCLARLSGKPLLEWQLEALNTAGIDDITVVRGYRADCLVDPRYAVLDNPDWAHTNMVETLACAESFLRRETCLVLYSDIVYHPDIVRSMMSAEGDICIAYDTLWESLWRLRFPDPLADAETFIEAHGMLVETGNRASSLAEIRGQYMGILRFTPRGWDAVSRLLGSLDPTVRARLDMTGLLQRLLAEGQKVHCCPIVGRWCEVDSAADMEAYETAIEAAAGNGRWSHDWRVQALPDAPEKGVA
jgi:choline kinase